MKPKRKVIMGPRANRKSLVRIVFSYMRVFVCCMCANIAPPQPNIITATKPADRQANKYSEYWKRYLRSDDDDDYATDDDDADADGGLTQ